MTLQNKQTARFLYAAQGVGIAFAAIFLIAYLAGLAVPNPGGQPGTVVLHSELAFRAVLAFLGAAFLGLIAVGIVYAAKKKQ